MWHDATANKLYSSLNGAAANETAATGFNTSTADFIIGEHTFYWNGLIDEFGFWSRVLTAQERTDLYNAGAGLFY
jgi:hypothetical protein